MFGGGSPPEIGMTFTGDKKNTDYFLSGYDRAVIRFFLLRVPAWLNTEHLTLSTLAWAALAVECGRRADADIRWLWALSGCIILQHLTDMLDGAVGRARASGLVKWGFYMDHFLDYIFLGALNIAYSFLLPPAYRALALAGLTISGAFMAHFFLDFAVTQEFKISFRGFGSSEIRYVLVLANVGLIYGGKHLLIAGYPGALMIAACALIIVVHQSQRTYGRADLERLRRRPPR